MRSRDPIRTELTWLRLSRREHATHVTVSLVLSAVAIGLTVTATSSLGSKLTLWVVGFAVGWIVIRLTRRATEGNRVARPAPREALVEDLAWTALATGVACAPTGLLIIAGVFSWSYAAIGGGLAFALLITSLRDARATRAFEKRNGVELLHTVQSPGRIAIKKIYVTRDASVPDPSSVSP